MTLLRKLIRMCGALLALLLVAPALPTSGLAQAHRQQLPLTSHLRPDRTLDRAHAQGALDPRGYPLSLAPDDAPRFAPSQAGDAGWDDRFGVPGVYNGDVVASAVSAAGDLYVAGSFRRSDSSIGANHVARWDGRRWYPLGEGVSGDLERVRAIATHATDVYVAGAFTHAGGVAARQVARWDGTAWHALGTGTGPVIVDDGITRDGSIRALAVGPNGDLYVGGSFTQIDATPANGVARWDGTAWHALGSGIVDRGVLGGDELFPATIYALAAAADGSLYAGGQFSDAGDGPARNIARWDGTAWENLGTGARGGDIFDGNQVTALALDGDRLYVGGSFTQAGDGPATNIAMWDGAAWSTLGAGVSSDLSAPPPVLTLLVQDGALYAGGAFSSAGGRSISGLARWDGTQWSAVGGPLEATGFRISVRALAAAPAGGLFAGGGFERAGGRTVNGIARWSGADWENLGQGVTLLDDSSAIVDAVAVDAAGRVYVGGMIDQVGGLPVNNIAMWDGARWHAMGGGVTSGPDGVVSALLVVGDDLYVGGVFTQAGGQSAARIARWNITSQSWSAVGAGFDGEVMALVYGDGVLYAGGSFDQAGDITARDVAAWDGASWQALGGDWEIFEVLDSGNEAGTFVRALAYHGGELFIGGHFQTIHRKGASTQDKSSYLAVHNVVGYTPGGDWFTIGQGGAMGVTTNGFSGFSTTVYALAAVNGGLYIGGTFNRGGGLLTPNLARWDLGSGTWSSPGTPAAERDVNVTALARTDRMLLVGGTFTSLNDAPARSVAVLDTVTGAWDTLDGGMRWKNGTARVRAAAIRPDTLFIGGQFSQAGPHPSLGFAHYNGDFGAQPLPEDGQHVYLPLIVR
jgi:trimeric autotransporter adhesin